jgi:uncharacterized membrane protein YbaN (DUF454 family)
MNAKTTNTLPAKVIACVVAAAFILFGVAGLVLPFIPGLLLLVLAAVVVAKNFPTIDGWLRKSRVLGRHMEWADTFYELPLKEKARLCAWVCGKVLVDTLALVGSAALKVWSAAVEAFRGRDRA